VLVLRGEEPQSFRDLALVLSRLCEEHLAAMRARGAPASEADKCEVTALSRRTVELLKRVVEGTWDHRFSEVEVTALVELNAFRAYLQEAATWMEPSAYAVDFKEHTQALSTNLHCDLRISLGWDTDMVDIDLHVVEPTGEEAYYGHRNTRIGGMVSRDFTQGYGPEEYMLKVAPKGKYSIWTNYYSNSRQDMSGATSLLLSLYTDYGRGLKTKHQQVVLRLNKVNGRVDVGGITI